MFGAGRAVNNADDEVLKIRNYLHEPNEGENRYKMRSVYNHIIKKNA